MQLKKIHEIKGQLSIEQKRRLLIGLRKLKEGYAGMGDSQSFGVDNTDIDAGGNLATPIDEDEFTSNLKPEPKVVAKTFDTNADFDSYVNQRRGIEMTPKEIQAVMVMAEQTMPSNPQQSQIPSSSQPKPQPSHHSEAPKEETVDDKIRVQKSQTFIDDVQGADILSNFLAEIGLAKEKPTRGDKFHMEYDLTDDFGSNTTTVIKKLKEGNQFCWTAFSKYETAEEEGNPNKKDKGED